MDGTRDEGTEVLTFEAAYSPSYDDDADKASVTLTIDDNDDEPGANPTTPPNLPDNFDRGASNRDNITNVTTPRFTGLEPNNVGKYVRVYVDGRYYGGPSVVGSDFSVTRKAESV